MWSLDAVNFITKFFGIKNTVTFKQWKRHVKATENDISSELACAGNYWIKLAL